jgi:hypothetical protein
MLRLPKLIWAGLTAAVIVPVVGSFFSEWAKEKGFYERPSAKFESAMDWIIGLGANPTYLIFVGFMCGVAVGLCFNLIRRKDQRGAATTSNAKESEGEIEYAHGLALERVQPSLDLRNAQNTLETRLVLRNASGAPVKFLIERFDVVMFGNVVKSQGMTAIIPKDGEVTLFPGSGFSKKQYAAFDSRGIGSVEYSIVYGPPNKSPSRRTYKLMSLDLFKAKQSFNLNWIIQNESDEPI